MEIDKIIDKFRNIQHGTAGSSIKLVYASNELLQFVTSNDNYDEIINKIYDYYHNEYKEKINKKEAVLNPAINELREIIMICSNILLPAYKKDFIEVLDINVKDYSLQDIKKFIKFTSELNEKESYQLQLDSYSNLLTFYNQHVQNKLEDKITITELKLKKFDEKIDKINFDIIGIISIFVAIIFSLFGGSQLLCNIFENITPCNYRLLVKTALIIGFTFSIFISLLLINITHVDKSKKTSIFILNILYAILCFILFLL